MVALWLKTAYFVADLCHECHKMAEKLKLNAGSGVEEDAWYKRRFLT